MSNFNDEFCEYNYSTPVTENFVNSDTNKLNNEKIIHNRQVAVQYGQCYSNCYSSYQKCQMYKTESMFDMNKCTTNCDDIWKKTYEK